MLPAAWRQCGVFAADLRRRENSSTFPAIAPLWLPDTLAPFPVTDLEWRLTYIGNAESEEYDQVLDSVLVGPVFPGQYRFVFQVGLGAGRSPLVATDHLLCSDQQLSAHPVSDPGPGSLPLLAQADPPDPARLPQDEILGITAILLTCSYNDKVPVEFQANCMQMARQGSGAHLRMGTWRQLLCLPMCPSPHAVAACATSASFMQSDYRAFASFCCRSLCGWGTM